MTEIATVLVALYLRRGEAGMARARGWGVLGELRRASPCLSNAARVLQAAGYWGEALRLEIPGLLAWAEAQVLENRVLTCVDEGYPSRWFSVLGSSAPLALWRCGGVPLGVGTAVVGSRVASLSALSFCRSVASSVVEGGGVVYSGGAVGCDLAAARGAGASLVSILPFGLSHWRGTGCGLSVWPFDEPFSIQAAMERNALVYAAAETSVVGHVSFRRGGTWHGAVDALRRRRSRVVVFDDGSAGVRALVGLGASAVSCVEEVFCSSGSSSSVGSGGLFSLGR